MTALLALPDLRCRVKLSIAKLYTKKGDLERAEQMLKRALTDVQRALESHQPEAAIFLHHIASLYWDRGDYACAEPLFERALEIRERLLGPDHDYVARTLTSLALLYQKKGNYSRASLCSGAHWRYSSGLGNATKMLRRR